MQATIRNLLVSATLAPLFSAVLVIFFGKRVMGKAAGWFATVVMGGACVCALYALYLWVTQSPGTIVWNIPWIPISGLGGSGGGANWLYLGIMVDSLTIAMMVMVTMVATLVHLYSIGYMAGDKRFELFFAYLSLFAFSMLGIVVSNSILMLFVFWELVGLTSYLLIGFWFEKRGPRLACKKAFVMNRIGDTGFLIGFGILFFHLGGRLLLPATEGAVVNGQKIISMFGALTMPVSAGGLGLSIINHPPLWLTAAGIALFFGAIGKSAQFPLHTWLPDAMEGPTPVSSIVHSATMVAAGVYLTARIYPILTPSAHLFVATIGLITLVLAAAMAMVMTDIKRVLAYSTLSQLGYMILGLGAGAYAFALFHLITHAFFKCALFQCSGSVIRAAHHQQDMRYYGGLWRKMPVTAICYLICTLAIAGASIPWITFAGGSPSFTTVGISGYYSKDAIIAGTVGFGQALHEAGWWAAPLFYYGPIVVAYVTCFYMGRSFALTFLGKPRDLHLYEHAEEAPWTMTVPQLVLAAMAVVSVPWLWDWQDLIDPTRDTMAAMMTSSTTAAAAWVQPAAESQLEHAFHLTHNSLLHWAGWMLALGAGILLYRPGMKYSARIAALPGINLLYRWTKEKFYFDALYDSFAVGVGKTAAKIIGAFDKWIIDGLVNAAGIGTQLWARLTGLFDNEVVDGLVNGAALVAQDSGQLLRQTQAGRVRVYVLLLLAVATLLATVAVVTVLVIK